MKYSNLIEEMRKGIFRAVTISGITAIASAIAVNNYLNSIWWIGSIIGLIVFNILLSMWFISLGLFYNAVASLQVGLIAEQKNERL